MFYNPTIELCESNNDYKRTDVTTEAISTPQHFPPVLTFWAVNCLLNRCSRCHNNRKIMCFFFSPNVC